MGLASPCSEEDGAKAFGVLYPSLLRGGSKQVVVLLSLRHSTLRATQSQCWDDPCCSHLLSACVTN